MTKKLRKRHVPRQDPHLGREKAKYAHPIPSREYIIDYLNELGRPVSFNRLVKVLGLGGVDEDKVQALRFRLKAMLRDGQLIKDRRDRFCLIDKVTLKPGRIMGHPDGYGFFIPDDGSEDLFISARQMRKVFHGDRVLARRVVTGRARVEGVIHEVLEHKTLQLVGRFYSLEGISFLEPDSKRITQDIQIPQEHRGGAKPGQIVVIELIFQPSEHSQPVGRVIEILGTHMAPGMEVDVAIRSYGLPHIWSKNVKEEIASFKGEVSEKEKVGRVDLRALPFVTIDGEDAKDFDDAVYCEKTSRGGWRLFVAIADVSHYVQANSALDGEAIERGNSVYFPERVIPMLPEKLSTHLCSLLPLSDRLCLVCEILISSQGKMTRSRFYEAIIHSQARLTYTQVENLLVNQDKQLKLKLASLLPHLNELYALYKSLYQVRQQRGALDFDTLETRIVFDKKKKIKQIVPVERTDAHRLIEECMLMANVSAAHFLQKHKMRGLYRVHDYPVKEKITDLRDFLAELGIELRGGTRPQTKELAKVIEQTRSRPDHHMIQTVLLRTLSQAEYSVNNIGHFGLAYKAYAHFTSPIRRYPDLLLHRAIRHILQNNPPETFIYSQDDLRQLAKRCSETERRADEATRDVISWLKCEYMQDKLGEEFNGIISAVTSFGIFVELIGTYIEGLVHVTGLKRDYYQYDPKRYRLVGERTNTKYHIGDKARIRVVRVDLDDRKIDFELI